VTESNTHEGVYVPPGDPSGWLAYVDKTGTPCAYCDRPSTETLIVEPDDWAKDGDLRRRGIRVGVCEKHTGKTSDGPPPAVTFRRRGLKDVDQTSIEGA